MGMGMGMERGMRIGMGMGCGDGDGDGDGMWGWGGHSGDTSVTDLGGFREQRSSRLRGWTGTGHVEFAHKEVL